MAQGSIKKVLVGEGEKRRTVYRARLDAGTDPVTGKRRQPMKTCNTKKAAQAWLTAELHKLATGTYTDPSTLTYGDYLYAWLDGPARRLHPNTQRAYASLIKSRIAPALGGVPIQNLRFDRLERFMRDQERSARPATIQTLQAILRGSLRDAERGNLVAKNPALLLAAPPVRPGAIKAWDEEQARAFLRAARESDEYPLYLLMLATGLRIGEALGLTWADLDLDAGTMQVARTQTRDRAGKLVLGDRPKSDNSRRLIPLDAQVIAGLREHRLRQLQQRMPLADVWENRDLVFPNGVGALRPSGAIRQRFARLCEQAGLPNVGLHGLRRTVGSVLLVKGESLKAAADLLGHGKLDVTFRRYVKATDQQRKQAAATMAKAVLGG